MGKKQEVVAEETETVVVHEPPPDPDALPSAMYEVYAATVNVHNAVPLPSWLQLDDLQKNAWRMVAKGVTK